MPCPIGFAMPFRRSAYRAEPFRPLALGGRMAQRQLLVLGTLASLAALVALPAAEAHSRVQSDDGRYGFSIGLLNEPVVTYAKTGLDVCVQQMPTRDGDGEPH